MSGSDISPKTLLSRARLYVLIDSVDFCDDPRAPRLNALVERLVNAQVSLIQLRDKKLTDRDVITVGKMIAKRTGSTNTGFILNDHAVLAVRAGADGVHLGQDDQDVAEAKLMFGSDLKVFGVSTHSLEQAHAAVAAGADYLGVGPVFPSRTKSFKRHVGLDLLRAVAHAIEIPAFAIGGIDLTNVDQVIAAGMPRVAVSHAVVAAADPAAAAQEFISQLRVPGGEQK